MAEAPVASFTRVEAPKPKVVERVKQKFSPEQRRVRREAKAAERRMRSVPEARLKQMSAERSRQGRALNLQADGAFDLAVYQEKQKALQQHSLSAEIAGNQHQFSPSELADIQSRAYAELAKSNPALLDYYRREGLYFSKPDRNGNCRPDYKADPFMRAVDQQVQTLRVAGDGEGAHGVLDSFARDCPDKAKMYAVAGHKGMQEALQRIGPSIDATPAAKSPAREAAPTVNLAEQAAQQKAAKIEEYKNLMKGSAQSMGIESQNRLRVLKNELQTEIAEVQRLKTEFAGDPNRILTSDELSLIKQYESLPEAAPAAAPAAAVETTAQKTAREAAEYQAARGTQSMTELQSLGLDFTKGEKEAMEALKSKGWTEDPDTLKYIHAGFVEHQTQQAAALVSGLSPEANAQLDQAEKEGKLKKGDLLAMLALLLAMGIAPTLKDSATQATTP